MEQNFKWVKYETASDEVIIFHKHFSELTFKCSYVDSLQSSLTTGIYRYIQAHYLTSFFAKPPR